MTSRVWGSPVLLLLLLPLLLLCADHALSEAGYSCPFPGYLQTGQAGSWLYKIHNTGAGHVIHVRVHDDSMTFEHDAGSSIGSAAGDYTWVCQEYNGRYTFVIRTELRGAEYFQCVQFQLKSSTVMQMARSSVTTTNPGLGICEDTHYTTDEWLMVRLETDEGHHTACPVSGGFNLRLFDRFGAEQCLDNFMPARMEAHCGPSQALHFDFHDCPQERLIDNMQRFHRVHCTAWWVQDGFTFVVLQSDDHHAVWSMRVAGNVADVKDVIDVDLLSDVVADVSNVIISTRNFVRFRLERIIHNDGVCKDATDKCPDINTLGFCGDEDMTGNLYCKRTCDKCTHSASESTCSIGIDSLGEWKFIGQDCSERDCVVSLRKSEVQVPDVAGHLTCITKDEYFEYPRYHLVRYQDNGCYPSFHCVSIEHFLPPNRLIAISINQGATWPEYEDDHHCNARTPTAETSSVWNFALPQDEELLPIECDLEVDVFQFQATYAGEDKCNGRLYNPSCGKDKNNMILDHTECVDSSRQGASRYKCIASFQAKSDPDESNIFVLEHSSASEEGDSIFCLVKSNITSAHLMSADQCLGFYFSGRTDHIAKLQLVPEQLECARAVVGNYAIKTTYSITFIFISIILIAPLLN